MTLPLIFLLTLLIYYRSIDGEFLTDDAAILDMEELRQKFSRSLYHNPLSFLADPRAVTHLTYQWTWKAFSFDSRAWHVGNVLIHLITTLVFALTWSRLELPYSEIATATFALHPLQVPAVAWISGRAAMLAAMFAYTGYFLLLTGFWPIAIVAQLLAMKSKEDGVLYLALWPILILI